MTVVDSAGHVLASVLAGCGGTFTITSASGSNLTIQITAPGYIPGFFSGVSLVAGSSLNLGTISVQPASLADPNGGDGSSNSSGILGTVLEWATALGTTQTA